jgi:transcriptional regulator GlxA family with amidase domain
MVIPRGVVHRLRMEGVRTMQTDWMMVNFEGLGGMDLLAAARIPLVLSRSTGRRLSELMAVLRDLDPSARQGDLIALARHQVTGFCILEILLEHAEVRSLAPTDPGLERLLPVLQYVEANLVRPISMASLAKQMSLSPSRFHCVFTRVMGIPPMSYVQDARLRMAQRLLLTSSKPVGEIAALTGFSSPYYFSRFFRQRLKTTPTAFRHDPNWFSNTL